jgi:hypothetical protein
MNDVERLKAIEEIRTLRARYWRYLDTQQWQAFGELFVEDAVSEGPADGFKAVGRDQIQSAVAAALDGVRTVHLGCHSEIEVLDEEHARGIWAMADLLHFPPGDLVRSGTDSPAALRGYGYYVDEYVKQGSNWLFARADLHRLHREFETVTRSEIPDELLR